MRPLLALCLLALAAPPLRAAAVSSREVDAAIGLDGVMERTSARVAALDGLSEKLEDLTALYAEEGLPPAGTRTDLRRAAEAEDRRVHACLCEYWHLAETIRVLEAAGVVGRAVRHEAGLVDAGKAAQLMGVPQFPVFVKAARTRVLHALEREDRAYATALKRAARRRTERMVAATATGVLALAAAALALARRREPPARVMTPSAPRMAAPNDPPRLT
ncbi:MAG: hypothetical protein HY928_02090 [Elusimicrobia bacterium]|nr:hypothetical protein [Elusimicrobiota bacterium]